MLTSEYACREDQFGDIMAEREDIATKRVHCQNAVRALQEAQSALEALPGSLMQRLQAQSSSSSQSSSSKSTALTPLPEDAPVFPSHTHRSSDYDTALHSVSPTYARTRRGPYNVKAMSQAARMASEAMSYVSTKNEADMRRAESLANPFCYES